MTLSWKRALIVARREYLTAVKRKAFLFTLIVVPLYFGGVMAFASRGALSAQRDTMRSFTRLGVVDSSGLYADATRVLTTSMAADLTGSPAKRETYRTDVVFYTDQQKLEQALRSGEIPQALVIPADYLASGALRRYSRSEGVFTSGSAQRSIERWLTRNLLAGQADGSRFTIGEQTLPLPAAAPRAGALLLGVRPEHAQLDPGGSWPMEVELLEMLGAERLVYGRVGGAAFTLRIEATLPPPRPGETVRLQVRPEGLHWFDRDSGMRVG